MNLNISELDCFFLSYDEPNREKHWALLLEIAPWAKRVDGIKGFDAAHKQCAIGSDTEYLITVDGDNQVRPYFFDLSLTVPDQLRDCVLSWNSVNEINGLVYGNGGVKIWPKQFLLNMKSHENAESESHAVDFCWDEKYIQLNNVYSTTYPNASPLQAFRSGFREGCKMTLNRGKIIDNVEQMVGSVFRLNIERLQIWGSLGEDVDNGFWAILGTRVGMHYTNVLKSDIGLVADYDAFAQYAESWLKTSPQVIRAVCKRITNEVLEHTGMSFLDFDEHQSRFIKNIMRRNYHDRDPLVTETEVLKQNA